MQTFIKITVADAQAPSITRPSAAMMLTMNDKLAPAFYGEEFQLTVPSLCREIQICFNVLHRIRQVKGADVSWCD